MSLENNIFWDKNENHSFEDYSVVLPDISIGNVGQLTVDLLLNNLEVEFLGRIVHPCFYPFIGSDPFYLESTRLSSPCEIYECKKRKLIILQLRSRVFPSKFQDFKELILKFFKQFMFKQTILIASSSSEYFSAEQLQSVPLHYLNTSKVANIEIFTKLQWKKFSLPDNVDTSIISPIPGSFVSEELVNSCEEENIPLVVLLCVCSEGNNYPEALHMADCLNSWLSLEKAKEGKESWKMPVSWQLPYGNDPPKDIY